MILVLLEHIVRQKITVKYVLVIIHYEATVTSLALNVSDIGS